MDPPASSATSLKNTLKDGSRELVIHPMKKPCLLYQILSARNVNKTTTAAAPAAATIGSENQSWVCQLDEEDRVSHPHTTLYVY